MFALLIPAMERLRTVYCALLRWSGQICYDLALLLHFCRGLSSSCKAGTSCKGLYLCCAPLLLTETCAEQVVDLVCSMLLISASFPRPAGPSYSTPASLRTVAQRQHVQQAEPQLVSQAQSTPGWQDLCLQVHPCDGGFQHTGGSRSTAKSLHTKLVAGLQLSVQLFSDSGRRFGSRGEKSLKSEHYFSTYGRLKLG